MAALAKEILTLNEELAELDAVISGKVTEPQHSEVLLSCLASAQFTPPNSSERPVAISPYPKPPTGSQALSDWPRHPGIHKGPAATTTGPDAMTGGCSASFTSLGSLSSNPAPPRVATTTANLSRENPTSKRCCLSPDAASMFSALCSAMELNTQRPRQ